MRTIKKQKAPAKKQKAPAELDAWREHRRKKDNPALCPFDYGAMRRAKEVLAAVEDGLLVEQGGICAYAGRRIRSVLPFVRLSSSG
ncbi:MAG: hypothetical protein R3F19_10690 [Verrucomicrobiales bacterium]